MYFACYRAGLCLARAAVRRRSFPVNVYGMRAPAFMQNGVQRGGAGCCPGEAHLGCCVSSACAGRQNPLALLRSFAVALFSVVFGFYFPFFTCESPFMKTQFIVEKLSNWVSRVPYRS